MYVYIMSKCSYSCPYPYLFSQLRRQNLLPNCKTRSNEVHAECGWGRGAGGIRRIARGGFMTLVRLFLSFRKSHANDSQRQMASVLRMFESSLHIVSNPLLLHLILILSSLSYLIFFSALMQISLLKFCWCQFTFLYIKKTLNESQSQSHWVIV